MATLTLNSSPLSARVSSSSGTGTSSSSVPSPTASTTSPVSASTNNATSCTFPTGCAPSPPTTLYLYTFITTLLVLLAVSTGIVARSRVLRRRAIANGTWQPRARESNAAIWRRKPQMRDVYIAAESEKDERWRVIQPLSASEVSRGSSQPPKILSASAPNSAGTAAGGSSIHTAAVSRLHATLAYLHHPLRHEHSHPEVMRAPAPVPVFPTFIEDSIDPVEDADAPTAHAGDVFTAGVRVAVLVAMPTPAHDPISGSSGPGIGGATSDLDEEEQIPHLEFGILDVEVAPAQQPAPRERLSV